jgi:hypothetical protein
MKKLIILALIAGGAWYALKQFQDSRPAPSGSGEKSSGANAQQRIDNLSGAAPADH